MNIFGIIYVLSFFVLLVYYAVVPSYKLKQSNCFFECLIFSIDSFIFYFITNDFEYVNGFILGIAILILLKKLDYIDCKFYKGKKK